MGRNAGEFGQGSEAISIGHQAGQYGQLGSAVAVGYLAGFTGQQGESVAIGREAGKTNQGLNAVAIGYAAGRDNQGTNAIAIGEFASLGSQAANSIVIDATGLQTIGATANALYINPIRNIDYNAPSTISITSNAPLVYDTASREITTSDVPLFCGVFMNDDAEFYYPLNTTGTYVYLGIPVDRGRYYFVYPNFGLETFNTSTFTDPLGWTSGGATDKYVWNKTGKIIKITPSPISGAGAAASWKIYYKGHMIGATDGTSANQFLDNPANA
jgi:secreted PhoX family phosphatase